MLPLRFQARIPTLAEIWMYPAEELAEQIQPV
jgi:hypothetical protein